MSEMNPSPPATQGDADQAVLDEAWAGLSQMLSAATVSLNETAPLNEAALVVAVCRRLARRQARRRRLALALAAALLAAVSLAAVGGTWMGKTRDNAPVAALPSKNAPSEMVAVAPRVKPATDKTAPSAVWNDDWEDELAQAQQEVLATKESWRQPADWLATVRQRMNELEAEFGEGAL